MSSRITMSLPEDVKKMENKIQRLWTEDKAIASMKNYQYIYLTETKDKVSNKMVPNARLRKLSAIKTLWDPSSKHKDMEAIYIPQYQTGEKDSTGRYKVREINLAGNERLVRKYLELGGVPPQQVKDMISVAITSDNYEGSDVAETIRRIKESSKKNDRRTMSVEECLRYAKDLGKDKDGIVGRFYKFEDGVERDAKVKKKSDKTKSGK